MDTDIEARALHRLTMRLSEQLAEAMDRMEEVRDLWPSEVRGLPDLECSIDTLRYARGALEEEGQ